MYLDLSLTAFLTGFKNKITANPLLNRFAINFLKILTFCVPNFISKKNLNKNPKII